MPALGLTAGADTYNALIWGCSHYGQNASVPKVCALQASQSVSRFCDTRAVRCTLCRLHCCVSITCGDHLLLRSDMLNQAPSSDQARQAPTKLAKLRPSPPSSPSSTSVAVVRSCWRSCGGGDSPTMSRDRSKSAAVVRSCWRSCGGRAPPPTPRRTSCASTAPSSPLTSPACWRRSRCAPPRSAAAYAPQPPAVHRQRRQHRRRPRHAGGALGVSPPATSNLRMWW